MDAEYDTQPVATLVKKIFDNEGDYGRFMLKDQDPLVAEAVKHGRIDKSLFLQCNAEYGAPGTTQNCAKCAATLELAKRGFDFMAGRQTYPSSVDAQSYWFKGAERMHMDTDITEKSIRSFGKKTSGTLSIQYPENAGGHAMHWTIDDEGNFEIQDGQNKKKFSSLLDMMDTYGADKTQGVDVFRLDNCEPDWDHMASDSVVRGSDGAYRWHNRVRNKFSNEMVDTW